MMFSILVFWLVNQNTVVSEQNLAQMENSCFSGSITICVKISEYYEKKHNYEKAIEFLDASCIGGDAMSCIKLYVIYAKGKWGKRKDFNIAMGYSMRAGELLGPNNSETFYKQSCDLDDSWGCFHLSNTYSERYNNQTEAQKILNKAINLAKKGCKEKEQDPVDCFLLGFLHENGKGVPKDEKKAIYFYEKSCEAGNGGACLRLANKYKEDAKKFKDYRIKSCQGSRGDICYELWKETKNKEYLELSCRFGFTEACNELFKMSKEK